MSRVVTSLVLWVTPLFACNAILGIEERSALVGEGGTSQGGLTGTGGDDGCPSGTACRAPAPEGWEGPVSLDLSTDSAGDCAVGTLVTGGVGTPGVGSCTPCTCDVASNETCPEQAVVSFFGSSDGSCSGVPETLETSATCTDLNLSPPGAHDFMGAPVLPFGGACAIGGGEYAGAPAFAQWAHLCQSEGALASCTDGMCAPGSGAACVYQRGQLSACPPGPYGGDPLVIATEIVDDRGCVACDCSAPSGGSCDGLTSRLYSSETCSQFATDIPHPSGCITTEKGSKQLIDTNLVLSPGTCTASGGELSGEVAVGEYLTLCCAD